MSRFEKLYEAMSIDGVDRATVLSEIFKCGGEQMFAELEKIYGTNTPKSEN